MPGNTPAPVVENANDPPFVGLRPFDIRDSPWFFGRNEQTYDMLRRLNTMHFLGVVGPSGCGKSSLVRAGLLASLRDGYLADDGDWTIVTLEPKNDPIAEWKSNLSPHCRSDTKPDSLMKDPASALDTSKGPMVILIDQFEDLFKFGKRTGRVNEVKDFIQAMLATAAEDARIFTIVTMRSEFIEQCALHPQLAEAMNEGLYLLPRMDREQLGKAIVGPIRKAGGGITVEFLDRLLDDAAREDDGLPILQHALAQLWPTRKRWEPMGMDLYPSGAGLGAYIDRHADKVYNGLGANKPIAELVFRAITETTNDGRALRRPLTTDQIMRETGISDRTALVEVIQAFQTHGFLRLANTASGSNELIDLTHEAVARQWNRFGVGSTREECWIVKEDRERKAAAKLGEAASDYLRAQEGKKSYLITGPRLDQLKASLGGRISRLPKDERDFLSKCESYAFLDTVFSRRNATVGFLVLVAIGGLLFYGYQTNAAAKLAAANAENAKLKEASLLRDKATAEAKVDQYSKAQTEALLSRSPARPALNTPVLYPQIWNAQQQPIIEAIRAELADSGVKVMQPQVVDFGPPTDELRYFFPQDELRAKSIVGALQKANVSVGTPKHVHGFEGKIGRGHLELWLKPKPTASYCNLALDMATGSLRGHTGSQTTLLIKDPTGQALFNSANYGGTSIGAGVTSVTFQIGSGKKVLSFRYAAPQPGVEIHIVDPCGTVFDVFENSVSNPIRGLTVEGT